MKRHLPVLPTFWDTFKQSFLQVYERLGFSVVISLIWFFAHLLVFLFIPTSLIQLLIPMVKPGAQVANNILASMVLYSVWNGLVTAPLTTALYGIVHESDETALEIKDYFRIVRQHYWSSVKVGLVFGLIVTLLFLNIVNSVIGNNLLLTILGNVSFFILFFLLLMQFYFAPLIYYKNNLISIAKKSFYLAGDNFGFTFVSLVMLFVLMALSFGALLPLVFAFGAFITFYINIAYEAIYKKYHPEAEIEDEDGKEDLIGENDNG
ncbi:MAG TPA: hypothetical protein PLZ08_08565 [Bacillota bacterium]|jgi:uncharacterized membrane protein YesL|nr:hypothetical protein [Bacillota bacterium]HPO97996.1 hypothetical protein [Bacillota bacterium]